MFDYSQLDDRFVDGLMDRARREASEMGHCSMRPEALRALIRQQSRAARAGKNQNERANDLAEEATRSKPR